MALRVALAVIALAAALLAVVAIPLGLHLASQDRSDFRQQTIATAVTLANVAEEHLGDGDNIASLDSAVTELRRRGDQVAVYGHQGQLIAGRPPDLKPGTDLVSRALAGRTSVRGPELGQLVVATPVLRDESSVSIGAVTLSEQTAALDRRIAELWTWLALVSALGLAAAALVATGLARWVSRPLAGLESAAQRLGAGELAARAPASAGPPEVRQLAGNFNLMAGRLEALVSSHYVMMADVSHQLRTPLAALRLRLDVLALAGPEDAAGELAGAQDEIGRLSRMVDGLLTVSRAENASDPAVRIPVSTVISERVTAWRPTAAEKPVSLEDASAGPVWAWLGEGHLEQVLDNLLSNALDAVPPGGRITIAARVTEGRARIIVADNGPGMPAAARETALRRHVSGRPGGTGLGLAIAHRLVTADGGTLTLSDTPGGGLTATADLRLAPVRPGRRS
jgi:signal transduction histidine kinase